MVIGIPLVIMGMRNQQVFQQFAWSTDQLANSVCDDTTGIALIHVSFSNTEPSGSSNAMKVTVEDTQTGKSIDLGIVQPGQTATGNINTGKPSISSSSVIFHLSWADGHSGTDTRSAAYSALTCHAPTATPTPSETPTLTPTQTPTPTLPVTITATATPTPSVCQSPQMVSNVKVTCAACQSN